MLTAAAAVAAAAAAAAAAQEDEWVLLLLVQQRQLSPADVLCSGLAGYAFFLCARVWKGLEFRV